MIRQFVNALRRALPAAMILLGALAGSANAGGHLQLKESIEVTADIITVGDLFTGAGQESGNAIFRAPSPGKSGVVSAARLAVAMRGQGLRWENPLGLREIVISRPGRLVDREIIESAIITRLAEINGVDASAIDYSITLSQRQSGFYVPSGAAADVAVLHFNYDPGTGNFRAVIIAPAGDPKAKRRVIDGQATEVIAMPVLRRPIARGDVITAGDIEMRRIAKARVNPRAIDAFADLAGMSARRALRPGLALNKGDVERPKIVRRNTLVTVIYQTGSLLVTARGRALDDGALGDAIDILNAKSNRKVLGTVTGPDTVSVASASTAIQSSGPRRQAALPGGNHTSN